MAFLTRRIDSKTVKKRRPRSTCARGIPRRLSFMPILRMGIIILMGVFLFAWAAKADDETDSDLEYRIKAAFLLNFCQFVTWPDTPPEKADAPIILCAIGPHPFKRELETIAGKKVRGGRPLEIRFASNMESISSCHLLFVGKSDKKELSAIIAGAKTKPILTVGDMEDFACQGGIIAFVNVDGKIRFEINPKAADAAGLKISSQLLKLAILTDETHREEN